MHAHASQTEAAPELNIPGTLEEKAINTIRNRVDQLGVGEVNIQKHVGADEIVVQLPGVDDLARVRGIIKSTAFLEFNLVEAGPFTSESAALQQYGGMLP